jgi:hypothetical protein
MDIRDEAALDLCSRLDELELVCRPGGPVSKRSPNLAADVTRKAMALKGSLLRLKQALQEAGPPPTFHRQMPPLYLRLDEQPAIRDIAKLVGHYGCPEDQLYAMTKKLAQQDPDLRVGELIVELTWVHKDTRWVKLRPETLRSLRPVIGPPPDADDLQKWWADKGGPPEPRSTEKAKPKEEPKPARKPTRKKKSA